MFEKPKTYIRELYQTIENILCFQGQSTFGFNMSLFCCN